MENSTQDKVDVQDKIKKSQETFYKLNKDKNVKKVYGDVSFNSKVKLVDVSLKNKGPKEDETFARNPDLRKSIRRGLSYMEKDGKGVQICRKGLEKFFDLKREFIAILDGEADTKLNLSKDDKKLMGVILDEPKEILQKGGKVSVYKTEKANGENAQVSYNPDYDAWIVASKNVSILVRKREDIADYVKMPIKRYSIATLIAEAWFNLLDKHLGGSLEKIQELKKELTGKTMIGEYCGHPLHQHLVEYKEITILFYAVVDLYGDRSCYPVQYCKDFIQKFNLPNVKVNKRGEFSTIKEMVEELRKLDKEVQSSTIEEDQEGTVLYFEGCIDGNHEILSLCKLKTLEYRIFRKMREKLKNLIAHKKSASATGKAFTKEVNELCKEHHPPRSLNYYFTFAQSAFNFAEENPSTASKLDIAERYIDFLKIIKKALDANEKLKPKDFDEFIRISNELAMNFSEDAGGDDEEEKKDTEEQKAEAAEEKKSGDDDQGEQNVDPKRIVLITPPLLLDVSAQEKIKKQFNLKEIESLWRDGQAITSMHSVVLLHRFPKIPKDADTKWNTYFVQVGFEKGVKNSILKRLNDMAEDDKFMAQASGQEAQFLRSKDKEAEMELLWKKAAEFETEMKKEMKNNFVNLPNHKIQTILNHIEEGFKVLKTFNIKPLFKRFDGYIPSRDESDKKKCIVLIPVGIPGMGKTTFFTALKKILKEKNVAVSSISSDDVRKEILDKIYQANPDYDRERAFEKSTKPAKEEFFKRVKDAIWATSSLEQDAHIVILDKNHPPGILPDSIAYFKDQEFSDVFHMKIVVVFPHIVEPYRGVKHNYPLSVNFLLTCINRGIGRDEHQTLVGDKYHIARVILGFFGGYKNFKANDESFKHLGAQYVMRIPFTYEEEGQQEAFGHDTVSLLEKVLKTQKGFNPDPEPVKPFLDKFEKSNFTLRNPSVDVLNQRCLEQLNEIFDLFGKSSPEKVETSGESK